MKRLLLTIALLLSSLSISYPQDFQKGHAAYLRGHYLEAFRQWEPLAEQGDADAQYNLGLMFAQGQGVQTNYEKALRWFYSAADSGFLEANLQIGIFHQGGLGTKQDFQKADYWLSLVAEQGDAQLKSIAQFFKERGLKVLANKAELYDDEDRIHWSLGLVSLLNYPSNEDYYLSTNLHIQIMSASTQGEKKRIFNEIKAKALEGDPFYQTRFAIFLIFGFGSEKNISEALKWLTLAAEQGSSHSNIILGYLYSRGTIVNQNFDISYQRYLAAAEKGNARAQSLLGAMYANGRGVKKDYSKAYDWYQKATRGNDAYAFYNIGCLYFNGQGVKHDYYEAARYFSVVHEASSDIVGINRDLDNKVIGKALNKIAFINDFGLGVSIDKHLSMKHNLESSLYGNLSAKKEVIKNLNIQNWMMDDDVANFFWSSLATSSNKLLKPSVATIAEREKQRLFEKFSSFQKKKASELVEYFLTTEYAKYYTDFSFEPIQAKNFSRID